MADLIGTIVYAGRLKDKSALMSSSSGGAFTAISDFFLKNDNAVVAAVYNYENHATEFQLILGLSLANGKSRERPALYWHGMSIRWISEVQRNKRNP